MQVYTRRHLNEAVFTDQQQIASVQSRARHCAIDPF